MQLADLKPYEDRELTLHMTDGETLRAKILFVDPEYDDVIVDLIGTNKPDTDRNLGEKCAYVFSLAEIARVS